jgi:hypothetical protein
VRARAKGMRRHTRQALQKRKALAALSVTTCAALIFAALRCVVRCSCVARMPDATTPRRCANSAAPMPCDCSSIVAASIPAVAAQWAEAHRTPQRGTEMFATNKRQRET